MNLAKIAPALAMLGLLIAVTGCAGRPTLAELEQAAGETGDWSKVERREAREKERMDTTPACPEHLLRLCVRHGMRMECSCVQPGAVADAWPQS